jgi:hypothetical protein
MPFCTLLSAKELRPYELPKFGQTLHPAFIGAEVFLGAARHRFQLGESKAVEQVRKMRVLLTDLLEQLRFVVCYLKTHG